MSDRPLVSVVTPTWRRHELVLGCIESVRAQSYRPLEHVIISDGLDEPTLLLVDAEAEAQRRLSLEDRCLPNGRAPVPITFVELGQHWSGILPDSYAAAPITVASFLARGSYQMWLSDDERMEAEHIALLVDALERHDADFAYSKTRMHRVDQPPEQGYVIGADPPSRGEITNVLYRAELLARGLYVFGDDRGSDWATIQRWLERGARAAFVDRVTLTHRVDR